MPAAAADLAGRDGVQRLADRAPVRLDRHAQRRLGRVLDRRVRQRRVRLGEDHHGRDAGGRSPSRRAADRTGSASPVAAAGLARRPRAASSISRGWKGVGVAPNMRRDLDRAVELRGGGLARLRGSRASIVARTSGVEVAQVEHHRRRPRHGRDRRRARRASRRRCRRRRGGCRSRGSPARRVAAAASASRRRRIGVEPACAAWPVKVTQVALVAERSRCTAPTPGRPPSSSTGPARCAARGRRARPRGARAGRARAVEVDAARRQRVLEPGALARRAGRARRRGPACPATAEEPSRLRPKRAPSSSAQSTSATVTGGGSSAAASARSTLQRAPSTPSAPSSQPPEGTASMCEPTITKPSPRRPGSVGPEVAGLVAFDLDRQLGELAPQPLARRCQSVGPRQRGGRRPGRRGARASSRRSARTRVDVDRQRHAGTAGGARAPTKRPWPGARADLAAGRRRASRGRGVARRCRDAVSPS